jgi:hypothetical protein
LLAIAAPSFYLLLSFSVPFPLYSGLIFAFLLLFSRLRASLFASA